MASNNTNSGFYSTATFNDTYSGNMIESNAYSGIWLSVSHDEFCFNNKINYNYIGVELDISNYLSILNNIANNNQEGFRVSNSANITISNNHVNNNYHFGFNLYQTNNMTFSNNIVNFNYYGIYLSNSGNNEFINCSIDNNKIYGFWITSSNFNFISESNFNSNQYGIYLVYSNNSVFLNNTLKNNIYCGFYLLISNYNVFDGNLVLKSNNGYKLSSSKNNLFKDNLDINNSYISNPAINYPISGNYDVLSILLNYTIPTGQNVSIYIDGIVNTTTLNSGIYLMFPQGKHNITIVTFDSYLNEFYKEVIFNETTIFDITNPKSETFNSSSISLNYDIIESNVTAIVYIDGIANNTNIPSGYVFASLSDGIHNITMKIIDSKGNVYIKQVSFVIDTTAPDIQITNPIQPIINSNSVQLNYKILDLSEISTLIYLDNIKNTTNIYSGYNFQLLSEGQHNLTIISKDIFGNTAKVEIIFIIDTIAPNIIVSNPNNGYYNVNTLNLTYQIIEINSNSTIVYFDGIANITNIQSGYLLLPLTEGQHNITIISTDLAGNRAEKQIIFVIDTLTPVITIDNPISEYYNSNSLQLNYSIIEINPLKTIIYLDGTADTTKFQSGSLFSELSDGQHNITIFMLDKANNWGKSEILFWIDATAPKIEIINPTANFYKTNSISLSYSIIEINVNWTAIYLDGIKNDTNINNGYIFTLLSEGEHNITIVSKDKAGNYGEFSVLFSIDTIAPIIQLNEPNNQTYTQNILPLNYTILETNTFTTLIYFDGIGNRTNLQPGFEFNSLTNGQHNLTIIVTDIAGNTAKSETIFIINANIVSSTTSISTATQTSIWTTAPSSKSTDQLTSNYNSNEATTGSSAKSTIGTNNAPGFTVISVMILFIAFSSFLRIKKRNNK